MVVAARHEPLHPSFGTYRNPRASASCTATLLPPANLFYKVYASCVLGGGKFAVAFIRWKSEVMFVVQMGEILADRGVKPM